MQVAGAAADLPNPRRSVGVGKIIGHSTYGHVEVSVSPRKDSAELTVIWQVAGGSIPEDQREVVITACREALESVQSEGRLRCGVQLIIEGGSYHDVAESAHAEASKRAVMDALKRGRVVS